MVVVQEGIELAKVRVNENFSSRRMKNLNGPLLTVMMSIAKVSSRAHTMSPHALAGNKLVHVQEGEDVHMLHISN